MSQQFMEQGFPLVEHKDASKLRQFVMDSLFGENANPFAENQWADHAEVYIRSNWLYISDKLEEDGIELSSADEVALMGFAGEYASLLDDEDDIAELAALRKEAMK